MVRTPDDVKTPENAICDEVEAVANAIEPGQFRIATSAANNLTRLAYTLESHSDVLLGEVVSTICGHIDFVLRSYQVGGVDRDSVHNDMVQYMADLVAAHQNKQDIYQSLEQMLFVATSFVLNAERRYPLKPLIPQGEQG